MAVAVSEGSSGARREPTSVEPKICRPTLRQPTFGLGLMDK